MSTKTPVAVKNDISAQVLAKIDAFQNSGEFKRLQSKTL
jgi:hypothetical protein